VVLLPVLKPADWDGLTGGARAHVWLGTPHQPLVLVAYAWEADDGRLDYVTRDNDPFPDRDSLVWQAFDNLERYHTGFELVESGGGRMLVSAGRPFAAERVLCQNHMLSAHEKLEADEILVSIPRRGAMLACAIDCPEQVRHTMISLHTESWTVAETDPDRITGELIVVEGGSKTGRMPISDLDGLR
jgi:hypothetical protein